VGVVVLLKPVEVKNDERDRIAVAFGQRDLLFKLRKKEIAIVNVGEGIEHGKLADALIKRAEDVPPNPVDQDEKDVQVGDAADAKDLFHDEEHADPRETDEHSPKPVHPSRHAVPPLTPTN